MNLASQSAADTSLPSPPLPSPRPGARRGLWALAALLALTLGLRAALALRSPIIGTDGEHYLWIAEDIRAGAFEQALLNPHGYHPLYSAAIAALSPLVGNPEAAALLIAVLASSLVAVPLYLLARGIWGEAVALLSLLLYALHPELLSVGADTMTEGLFLVFFLGSLALLWSASRRQRLALALGGGVCGGFAYLTRVEGIYLPAYLALGTLVLVALDLFPPRWSTLGRRLALAAAFAAGFAAVGAPFVLAIHHGSGRWHFTTKSSVPMTQPRDDAAAYYQRVAIAGVAGVEVPITTTTAESRIGQWKQKYGSAAGAALGFVKDFAKAGEFIHLPLIGMGFLMALLARRLGRAANAPLWRWLPAPVNGRGVAYLTLWALGCVAPIYLSLCFFRSDSDARYYLAGHALLLPWGAAALAGLWRIDRVLPLPELAAPSWRLLFRGIAVVAVVAMAAIAGFKLRRERRYDQTLVAEAGRVIRGLFPPGVRPRVLATRNKFVYYAGSRETPTAPGSYESDLEAARKQGLPILVGYRSDFLAADPSWEKKLNDAELERIPLANPAPGRMHDVLIYRVRDVPLSAPR